MCDEANPSRFAGYEKRVPLTRKLNILEQIFTLRESPLLLSPVTRDVSKQGREAVYPSPQALPKCPSSPSLDKPG